MQGVILHKAMWADRIRTLVFWLVALLLAASISVLATMPAHAATFTVNLTGDQNDLDFPGDTSEFSEARVVEGPVIGG